MPVRVGVDIGGTFTDLCSWDGRALRAVKVPSTPGDYVAGVSAGLEALGGVRGGGLLVYGSTVATNALLTRGGARVALVTTRGFGDLLYIGRQNRPELYELKARRPEPLVGRADCHEVDERIGADGAVVRPLDGDRARAVLERIVESGVREIAVCLLFSFLNPSHEQALGALAAELGLGVTLSSELLAEFREYERASTSVVNAYVRPIAGRHFQDLNRVCRKRDIRRVAVLQSNGGRISVETAAREPVRTVLSGPAGGVVAGVHEARRLGVRRLVTYDMGGTSTDVCLCDPEPARTTEAVIAGCPIRVPMIDIHTIGAGGGSVARVDSGGALQVGPESAGADPGPACYGRGEAATVTDANVVLGRIVPDRFLGGRMTIDPSAAERAVGRIAAGMRVSVTKAAQGIVAVGEAHMIRAIRRVSAERGVDPEGLSLCSFGGAGGLHACRLAEGLRMSEVLVPPNPGVLSATGMLLADWMKDFSVSLPGAVFLQGGRATAGEGTRVALDILRRAFSDLMDAAAHAVQLDGYEQDDSLMERFVDMRYGGQSHELTVPLASLSDVDRLLEPFHVEHERRFGHAARDEPVQLVTARIQAVVATEGPDVPSPGVRGGPVAGARVGEREIMFEEALRAGVYDRERLEPGHELDGPALIVEPHATTLVPPGWHARVESTLALRLLRKFD